MTSRERMLAVYQGKRPDRVPISPEIWEAISITVSSRPFYEVFGPLSQEPWWGVHLAAQKYFDCDAWLIASLKNKTIESESKTTFIDKNTLRTETTYFTSKGELHEISRTTELYSGWLIEHPIKNLLKDMERYTEIFFVDPESYDVSEIRETIEGVGDKGLVTPYVGQLFTSFLGSIREGGIGQAIYDLLDHESYCRDLQERYLKLLSQRAEIILKKTEAQALFLDSGYSALPIINPQIYCQWDKPVIQEVSRVAKKYNIPLHLHQHGYVKPIIEDIIQAGINVLCPLIPPPQGDVDNLSYIKERYGEKITLKGNVDPIEVLLKGTPKFVEEEVKRCLDQGASGGRFILGTADSVVKDTPFENIHAFVKAGKKLGQY